jgi:hypothetical protein
MFVWLTLIVSFVAAMIASTYAASTSIVRGDGLGREWSRRAVFGIAAIAIVWAIYFIVGGVIVPALGG